MHLIGLNNVWHSNDEALWNKALENYWHRVKKFNKSQLDVEYKLEKIRASDVRSYSLDEFYSFIVDDYFKWKFSPRNLESLRKKFCSFYVDGKRLDELQDKKNDLFSFDPENIEKGLQIVTGIKCMRVIAGSGLLAILYPNHFGTIDQFIIKSLLTLDGLPEYNRIKEINQNNPSVTDGVFLIELMRKKAKELNSIFNTTRWRPRDIDKVLWANRDFTAQQKTLKT